MKEQLSALVDDELNRFEEHRLLQELEREREPVLRGAWQRYHLIGAALRNELEHVPAPTNAEALGARLSAEPAPARSMRLSRSGSIAASLGIAASVAALAIFGLQTLNRPSAPVAMPVANAPLAPAPEAVRKVTTRWGKNDSEADRALHLYLVQHSEFASAGMRGMMPSYVRVVSSGSDSGQ
ncbi:MAG: sigma-E factor negative regulatory protein [Pseudomonadota bacterium]|nr:MAG: sigma-E factor negative regulatory protein [Pseudomonadota bacterium]